MIKNCAICGNEFEAKVHNAKCCGDACMREAMNARTKRWHKANRENRRVYERRYREENREKYLAHKRRYREANRDEELARNKRWREANREKRRVYERRYREEMVHEKTMSDVNKILEAFKEIKNDGNCNANQ